MLVALDLETRCAVPECKHFHKSICAEGHSLSPWHGEITQLAAWCPSHKEVAQGQASSLELLKRLLSQGDTFIAHNGKFDMLWLSVKAPELTKRISDAWVADTQLMAFVHAHKIPDEWLASYEAAKPSGLRAGGKHSLKTLAPFFLGVEPYWEAEGHESTEYVLKDVEYTYGLWKHLADSMTDEEYSFTNDKLLPWAKMALEMELRGLRLDIAGITEYSDKLKEREQELKSMLDQRWAAAHAMYMDILKQQVNARYDAQKNTKSREQRRLAALDKLTSTTHGVNYDSPAQMKWLLSSYLGYDIRSLEGDESTGKEVLIRLADEGHDDVGLYLEYRKTQKILSAFIPTLISSCDSKGILHPIYNVTGARTGRWSSERPNAQQIPKELKQFFKPRDGKLVGYDQSAIEAKLIAVYTEDPVLGEIDRTGDSIHNVNTVAFFDLECAPHEVPKVYGKQRKASKNVGFALFYGAGSNRIRIALTQGGFPVTQDQAKRMHKNFLSKYKVAIDYAKSVVWELENGGTLTNLLGRPINIERPEDAYMKGFNTLIQSSASDINIAQMHSAVDRVRAAGIECHPVLAVHDYAGIEVVGSDEEVAKADAIIKTTLSDLQFDTAHGKISLAVEGGVSDDWN